MFEELASMNKISNDDYRTLFVNIEEESYPISREVLYEVFSPFGNIENITLFMDGNNFHSSIGFTSREASVQALEALEDRCIYDGCCQLKLVRASEAAKEGKKFRYYILISSDEVFEKWDHGLCELCDELYFPGHKCVRLSPGCLVMLVDKEEETTSGKNSYKKCAIGDAHKLFDGMPELIEEDTMSDFHPEIEQVEKLHQYGGKQSDPIQEDVEFVSSNIGLLDKIDDAKIIEVKRHNSFTIDNTSKNAHQIFGEMPAAIGEETSLLYADKLLDRMSDESTVKKLSEKLEIIEEYVSIGHIMTSKVAEEFILLDKWVNENCVDISHYLCNLVKVFDPGEMQCVSNWLPFHVHTIHNLEVIGVNVYDPGGMPCASSRQHSNTLTIHNLEAINVVFDLGRLNLLLDGRTLYSYNKLMVMLDLKLIENYVFLLIWSSYLIRGGA